MGSEMCIRDSRLMVTGQNVPHNLTNGVDSMTIWQVVDINTSKGLPSGRRVVASFDSIGEATEFAHTDENFKVRVKPQTRRKKDEEDE